MGLVVVAAVSRDSCEVGTYAAAHAGRDPLPGVPEPHQAAHLLGRQADLTPEQCGRLPGAESDMSREAVHRPGATMPRHPDPSLADLGPYRCPAFLGIDPPAQVLLEQRKRSAQDGVSASRCCSRAAL